MWAMSLYLKALDYLHTKSLRRKYFGLTNMEIIQSHRFQIGYGQATSPHNTLLFTNIMELLWIILLMISIHLSQ